MASILSPYQPSGHMPTRRTNSLAFAKSDCHTCASIGLRCDRHRPRCSTCQDSGRLCQGYSMQLTWQRSHSAVNTPPKVKANRAGDGTSAQQRAECDAITPPAGWETGCATKNLREFTFVAGRPAKRRKQHHVATDVLGTRSSADNNGSRPRKSSASSQRSANISGYSTPSSEFPDTFDSTLVTLSYGQEQPSPANVWQASQMVQEAVTQLQLTNSPDSVDVEQCFPFQHHNDSPGAWTQLTSANTSDSWSDAGYLSESDYAYQMSLAYIPQMCFVTLHQKFSGLLNMCMSTNLREPMPKQLTSNFQMMRSSANTVSTLPNLSQVARGIRPLFILIQCLEANNKAAITNDFSINPYRYRPETTKGSRHLLHSILAITAHFRLRSPNQPATPLEALEHKNTAMVLYQSALTRDDQSRNGLSLLDTALALWQLEVRYTIREMRFMLIYCVRQRYRLSPFGDLI